jgi:hypothetical protein
VLIDRYPHEDVFARVPKLADQMDPVLVQLDRLLDDDELYVGTARRSASSRSSRRPLFGITRACHPSPSAGCSSATPRASSRRKPSSASTWRRRRRRSSPGSSCAGRCRPPSTPTGRTWASRPSGNGPNPPSPARRPRCSPSSAGHAPGARLHGRCASPPCRNPPSIPRRRRLQRCARSRSQAVVDANDFSSIALRIRWGRKSRAPCSTTWLICSSMPPTWGKSSQGDPVRRPAPTSRANITPLPKSPLGRQHVGPQPHRYSSCLPRSHGIPPHRKVLVSARKAEVSNRYKAL